MTILENPDFIAWVGSKPTKVQDVIRRVPPGRYRMKDQEEPLIAHYEPRSYEEAEDPAMPVTITCEKIYANGLPSYGVFGILPEDLIPIN